MAFNAYTGRAAVAIENCGNCGGKAIDQLTRNLVDMQPTEPHVLSLNRSVLSVYEGCYRLGDMTDKNRQPARNASLVTVWYDSKEADLRMNITDHGGAALLRPFGWTM